ncbi:MAG: serine protease [Methylobacter sp.]|nr:serine protease [Methylobacter sp.]
MNIPDLVKKVQSSIVHIVYVKVEEKVGADPKKKKVGSGTGFILDGYLVTNNHVIQTPQDTHFLLRFYDSDPSNLSDGLLYKNSDFMSFLKTGSEENAYDFAVFEIPKLRARESNHLKFGNPDAMCQGDDIVFLGYPLEHNNLVVHKGIISSFFKSGYAETEMIQIDASVNQSNSGGPLLDPSTGNVIGIISRKATGLSKVFEELNEVFDKNIKAMEGAKSMMSLGGLDPVEALTAGQNQMKTLCKEIQRSANVGIGYAISIKHLSNDNLFYSE